MFQLGEKRLKKEQRANEGNQKYTFKEYIQKISSLFPLPSKPPEMCHDEFIKQLLAPFGSDPRMVERHTQIMTSSSSSSSVSQFDEVNNAFQAKMYQKDYKARADMYLARATAMAENIRRVSSLTTTQRESAIKTHEMFQTRFRNLISDFRNVCVIFQLLQLEEILNVMREFPPEGTNPNETIFGWCYKDLLKRFDQQGNTVYVDILEMNKSDDTLDDLKFYVDLGEIKRLVQVLLNDVIRNRDLCAGNGFMELLGNTQVDVDKLIAEPYETVMAEHEAWLAEDAKKNRVGKFSNPRLVAKQRSLKKEEFLTDYMYPIQTRYKINWTYDKKEQLQYTDYLHCRAYTDELEKLADLTQKDLAVFRSVRYQYSKIIDLYKDRINSVQEAFDNDMEAAETILQTTNNRVGKCKDELKNKQDELETMRRKILEVQLKIAEEEKAARPLEDRKSTSTAEIKVTKGKKKPKKKKSVQ